MVDIMQYKFSIHNAFYLHVKVTTVLGVLGYTAHYNYHNFSQL